MISKIFSENLVIKVSNSNSKEQRIGLEHHDASCIIDEPPVMNVLWFDRVLLSETSFSRFWWFALRELSAVICLHVRSWPRPWNRTPLWWTWIWNITAWCLAFQFLEPGSQVSKSRASRVLHKPPSKVLWHKGPQTCKGLQRSLWLISGREFGNGRIQIDFLLWNATNCMLLTHFQAGDHSPRLQLMKYDEIFLTGPPRPNLVVSDLSSFSKTDKSYCAVK